MAGRWERDSVTAMRHIFARPVSPTDEPEQKAKDVVQCATWMARLADKNLVDPQVMAYPATTIICAERDNRQLLYVPVQQCSVMESLGLSPEASELDIAGGLQAVTKAVRWEAYKAGQREIMFLCRDEQTIKFAEHHGFEKVDIPLFRMKI